VEAGGLVGDLSWNEGGRRQEDRAVGVGQHVVGLRSPGSAFFRPLSGESQNNQLVVPFPREANQLGSEIPRHGKDFDFAAQRACPSLVAIEDAIH